MVDYQYSQTQDHKTHCTLLQTRMTSCCDYSNWRRLQYSSSRSRTSSSSLLYSSSTPFWQQQSRVHHEDRQLVNTKYDMIWQVREHDVNQTYSLYRRSPPTAFSRYRKMSWRWNIYNYCATDAIGLYLGCL